MAVFTAHLPLYYSRHQLRHRTLANLLLTNRLQQQLAGPHLLQVPTVLVLLALVRPVILS